MAQVAISEIETVTKAALMAHGAGAWQAGRWPAPLPIPRRMAM